MRRHSSQRFDRVKPSSLRCEASQYRFATGSGSCTKLARFFDVWHGRLLCGEHKAQVEAEDAR